MAFEPRMFGTTSIGNGFAIFQYITTDTITHVCERSYFDNLSAGVREGDIIIVNTRNNASYQICYMFRAEKNKFGDIVVIPMNG